jgi:hypothetical protein
VAALLGGCSAEVGGPCSATDPCDEGVCNLSGPGEPSCISADGDLDADGIPNRRDFCNQQAGGEQDEDGDGRGDECDPCPIAAPAGGGDPDGDGVESPCDPEPAVPGDRVVVFEGFGGALPAAWRREGGWEVRGGAAVLAPADPAAVGRLLAPLPLSSRKVAVFASYRIDRVEAGAAQSFAGVTSVDQRPAGTSTVTCSGQRTGTADALAIVTDRGSASQPFSNLFDPAALYRIAQRIDNASGACALDAGAQSFAVSQATAGETPTEAGLIARGATVKYQYLLVVQRGN